MYFPNKYNNIMNHNRNMYFYDEEEWGTNKPNPDPIIYQCDKFKSINTLMLNPVDAFNPNLLCYIPECNCNNNHKYDREK